MNRFITIYFILLVGLNVYSPNLYSETTKPQGINLNLPANTYNTSRFILEEQNKEILKKLRYLSVTQSQVPFMWLFIILIVTLCLVVLFFKKKFGVLKKQIDSLNGIIIRLTRLFMVHDSVTNEPGMINVPQLILTIVEMLEQLEKRLDDKNVSEPLNTLKKQLNDLIALLKIGNQPAIPLMITRLNEIEDQVSNLNKHSQKDDNVFYKLNGQSIDDIEPKTEADKFIQFLKTM